MAKYTKVRSGAEWKESYKCACGGKIGIWFQDCRPTLFVRHKRYELCSTVVDTKFEAGTHGDLLMWLTKQELKDLAGDEDPTVAETFSMCDWGIEKII